ncbi:MAG: molybdate ABC transporter substrate-binding protein [Planctomycetes bacterium]|nr:molybdate ABC transporter substrate-binding protein [Planctomycetota bacterium]
MCRLLWLPLLALLIAVASCDRRQEPVTLVIAAASDLRPAFEPLAASFAKTHPNVRLSPTFGSSGQFQTQIIEGAPFDVYLTADAAYAAALVDKQLADPKSLARFAVGRIALWTRADSKLDLATLHEKALTDPTVKTIAIANPAHAPYGRAAAAALESWGLTQATKPKLVLGENVAQAAQFAESGAADIGIIALSLAVSPNMKPKGRYDTIPAAAHPPIQQAAVVLSRSSHQPEARAFVEFLGGSEAKEVLRQFGFE